MKNDFSSAMNDPLKGRDPSPEKTAEEKKHGSQKDVEKKRTQKTTLDTTTDKKRSPGQPKLPEEKKKKQITITVKPETFHKTEALGKDYRKLLAKYIDLNIEDILNDINKFKDFI